MIKRIFGEENGLELSVEKDSLFLCPSKKNKIRLVAKNSTEYDMHLFFSFQVPALCTMEKKEADVFVPAEGDTSFEMVLVSGVGDVMYPGEPVLEFAVKDRVLEWTSGYEIQLYTETVFKCGKKNDFSPSEEMLVSNKGRIFIGEKECIMIECASEGELDVTLCGDGKTTPSVYLENKECTDGKIHITEKLNRICITSDCEQQIEFKNEISGEAVFLNTINPKRFL